MAGNAGQCEREIFVVGRVGARGGDDGRSSTYQKGCDTGATEKSESLIESIRGFEVGHDVDIGISGSRGLDSLDLAGMRIESCLYIHRATHFDFAVRTGGRAGYKLDIVEGTVK